MFNLAIFLRSNKHCVSVKPSSLLQPSSEQPLQPKTCQKIQSHLPGLTLHITTNSDSTSHTCFLASANSRLYFVFVIFFFLF